MYNENEINPELEEQLNNVFNKYMQDEYEYKELCVQVFEKSLEDNPEALALINSFKCFGATELEAKIKTIQLALEGM
jgi:hypothetical protein